MRRACSAELADAGSALHELFGRTGWERQAAPAPLCWSPPTSAYFDGVRAAGADSCDANWFTAGSGDLASPAGRPSFSAPAPAVLGYDASIFDFCTQQDVSGGGGGGGGSWQADVVARCVGANLNALRVLRGWNMCLNFRWLVCRSTFGQGLQRTDQGRHAHTHTHGNVDSSATVTGGSCAPLAGSCPARRCGPSSSLPPARATCRSSVHTSAERGAAASEARARATTRRSTSSSRRCALSPPSAQTAASSSRCPPASASSATSAQAALRRSSTN